MLFGIVWDHATPLKGIGSHPNLISQLHVTNILLFPQISFHDISDHTVNTVLHSQGKPRCCASCGFKNSVKNIVTQFSRAIYEIIVGYLGAIVQTEVTAFSL